LVDNADAGVLEAPDQPLIHIPEQHHPGHRKVQAGTDLLLKQRRRRGGGNQIDGEVFNTGGPQRFHFGA
jgi:hypothetical protein